MQRGIKYGIRVRSNKEVLIAGEKVCGRREGCEVEGGTNNFSVEKAERRDGAKAVAVE